MSAFESLIIVRHAKKLLFVHGSKHASEYLFKNGIDIRVALFVVTGKE